MINNDILNDLYNWIDQNYKELARVYAEYDNQNNINFTLFCVAMYAKHSSLQYGINI